MPIGTEATLLHDRDRAEFDDNRTILVYFFATSVVGRRPAHISGGGVGHDCHDKSCPEECWRHHAAFNEIYRAGARAGLGLAACSDNDDGQDAGASSLLDSVIDRGQVICGVNESVPGFGVATADGSLEGFDIDFCKAIAAAVLGDADAVEYVPLTAETRFTALQSGEIDVLSRNTTWTATRDGGEGAAFATTTFYDGQGMMVRSDSGIGSVDDMANTAVCVLSGTTTELNLEAQFSARGLNYDGSSHLRGVMG